MSPLLTLVSVCNHVLINFDNYKDNYLLLSDGHELDGYLFIVYIIYNENNCIVIDDIKIWGGGML